MVGIYATSFNAALCVSMGVALIAGKNTVLLYILTYRYTRNTLTCRYARNTLKPSCPENTSSCASY